MPVCSKEARKFLKIHKSISTSRLFALGFALIILVGAALLSLPIANKTGGIPFIDALFTACSATCVTGLVVYDTFSQFTAFGQVVIILLIQIGGLGFMTFAIILTMAAGRRISLSERINLSEAIGAGRLGGVVRLARRILIGTLLIEGTGALLLSSASEPFSPPVPRCGTEYFTQYQPSVTRALTSWVL